ncbi:MAG: hypothetical protein HY713_07070 [candidate division NC10 bacterium]|nr:hypothetical protein [candidate division NC10 bacterium]
MKKILALAFALVVMAVFAGLGAAQEEKKGFPALPRPGPTPAEGLACPSPMFVSIANPPTATPYAPDFPTPVPPLTNFGGTQTDKHLRHTFTWRPAGECCQYMSGKLTLQYRALTGGQSATSLDAGNDGVSVFSGGAVLLSLPVYTSFPFSLGQTGTKTIPLTPAMLTNNRLSFAVQDDTSVTSVKLEVAACCVRK